MHSEANINRMLCEIQAQLNRIEGTLSIMADNQDQLDAGIAAVQTLVTQVGADVAAAIASLEAKIATLGTSAVDFTPEVTSLTNIANTLKAVDTSALAANPPKITVTPSTVTIIGGIGATATVTAVESANPSASFTASTSNASIVTTAPGTAAGSFVITEVAAGTATITISDGATPVANLATVSITAS